VRPATARASTSKVTYEPPTSPAHLSHGLACDVLTLPYNILYDIVAYGVICMMYGVCDVGCMMYGVYDVCAMYHS
jgi:hypothetical protein